MSTKETLPPQAPMVDMKTHILTVASGLILEKGVKNMSLKDIAKTAGISKGTLYYYYSAKEDIIYDIAARNMSQITNEILAWIDRRDKDTDPDAILHSLYASILDAETRGRLHLYLLNDALTSNEKLAEKFKQLYSDWRQILQETLQKVFPEQNDNTEALSYLILASLDGLMIQKMCGAESIPFQQIINIILK